MRLHDGSHRQYPNRITLKIPDSAALRQYRSFPSRRCRPCGSCLTLSCMCHAALRGFETSSRRLVLCISPRAEATRAAASGLPNSATHAWRASSSSRARSLAIIQKRKHHARLGSTMGQVLLFHHFCLRPCLFQNMRAFTALVVMRGVREKESTHWTAFPATASSAHRGRSGPAKRPGLPHAIGGGHIFYKRLHAVRAFTPVLGIGLAHGARNHGHRSDGADVHCPRFMKRGQGSAHDRACSPPWRTLASSQTSAGAGGRRYGHDARARHTPYGAGAPGFPVQTVHLARPETSRACRRESETITLSGARICPRAPCWLMPGTGVLLMHGCMAMPAQATPPGQRANAGIAAEAPKPLGD